MWWRLRQKLWVFNIVLFKWCCYSCKTASVMFKSGLSAWGSHEKPEHGFPSHRDHGEWMMGNFWFWYWFCYTWQIWISPQGFRRHTVWMSEKMHVVSEGYAVAKPVMFSENLPICSLFICVTRAYSLLMTHYYNVVIPTRNKSIIMYWGNTCWDARENLIGFLLKMLLPAYANSATGQF